MYYLQKKNHILSMIIERNCEYFNLSELKHDKKNLLIKSI
jgi:hypothetical protein